MEDMLKLANQLNFDKEKFIKDFESREITEKIDKEIKYGGKLGIDATPTMYINGRKIVGVKPYYEFKEQLIEYGAKPRK